jgi:hypothetical protein
MKYGPLPCHTFEIGCYGQLTHKWREIITNMRYWLAPFFKSYHQSGRMTGGKEGRPFKVFTKNLLTFVKSKEWNCQG